MFPFKCALRWAHIYEKLGSVKLKPININVLVIKSPDNAFIKGVFS